MLRSPALLAALAALVASAAPAQAGTVEVQAATLVFRAAPGERNDVALVRTPDGAFTVRDAGAALTPGPGCAPLDTFAARCPVLPVAAGAVLGLGDGDDRLTAAGAPVTAYGEAGDDVLAGSDFADVLSGGPGADELHGGAGDDRLGGDDESFGGPATAGPAGTTVGDDAIDGGGGRDEVSYRGRTAPVTVDLRRAGAAGQAGEDDRLTGIEDVAGGDGADRLTGDGAANALTGGAGDDRLVGSGGDDRLLGQAGRNVMAGGTGQDVLDASGSLRRGACGRGVDTVQAPRRAAAALGDDCEWIATQQGATLTARPAGIHGRVLSLDGDCDAPRPCALRLRMRAGGALLAAGGATLPPGAAGQVRLRLTARGARLVRRAGRRLRLEVASARAGDPLGWAAAWRVP